VLKPDVVSGFVFSANFWLRTREWSVMAFLLAMIALTAPLDAPAGAADAVPAAANSTAGAPANPAPAASTPVESPAENAAATVSLSGMLTLQEVCTEIEKQTGNKVIDYRDHLRQKTTNPRFKLQIKNAPFWQAVDALLDSTHMTVYHYSGKDGLAIIDRTEDELPRRGRATYVGPLRLEVDRIVAERRPAMKQPGSLKLNLAVAWEPRLAPVMIEQPLTQIQAVDDQGQTLEFDGNEATLESAIEGGGTGVQLLFPFVPPPRSVTAIRSLKGTLNLSLPGKIETFEFDKLTDAAEPGAKPVEQTKDAVTVYLDQVRKNNDLWEVVTRIRFDTAGGSLEPHRNWILQNEACLQGPDHKQVENVGFHNSMQTNTELGIVYQFELPAGVEGYTFVYKTPTSIHILPVKYELKDLPLP
jgi:hypothetical protein